jgi:segregation and condensation protein A
VTPVSTPGREYSDADPFVVELDRFTGPLDLLLHLIRSQDIDIFDIPIARITRQFRTVLEAGRERLELDRAGEFLEMAATLVRIKSQLLLPRPGEPDWEEDPRSDLVRRLLEYEHFHEVARTLTARESERARHFGKGYVRPRKAPEPYLPELETGREELLEAAREIPEPETGVEHRTPVREVTVEEKMSLLGRLVRKVKRVAFERLFRPWKKRSHAVAALLACLEMARQQLVRIEQVEHFGSIWLFPGDRLEEDEDGGEIAGATAAYGPGDSAPQETPGEVPAGTPSGDDAGEEP